MNNDFLKQALTEYQNQQMELLNPAELPGYEHSFSRRFRRKIRRLFWSEKYFGRRYRVGYALRRIAIIVFLLISLAAAYEVSARIFHWGFRPWNMDHVKHRGDAISWHIVSLKSDMADKKLPKPLRLMPGYLPADYQIKWLKGDMIDPHFGSWHRYNNSKYEIDYFADPIREDESRDVNDELFQKRITVAGYEAFLSILDEGDTMIGTNMTDTVIFWLDTKYMHLLQTNMENAEQVIRAWAESIYIPPKPWQVSTFPADSPLYRNEFLGLGSLLDSETTQETFP